MSDASIYEAQSDPIPVINSLGNVYLEWQIATAGQTVFDLVSFQYTPGTNTLQVYRKPVGDIGGYFQQVGVDFAETDADTVTMTPPLAVGDKVAFLAFATDGVAIPNGGGLPAGGTAGQILSKINGSDYNAQWINQSTVVPLLDAAIAIVPSATTVDLTPLLNITRNISLTGAIDITGFQITNGQLYSCKSLGTFNLINSVSLACPGSANLAVTPGSSWLIRANADNSVEILCFVSPTTAITPVSVDVRQTVLSGVQDSSGDPAFLQIGAGLAINLIAAGTPLVITYAAGSGVSGDVNYVETFIADVPTFVSGLAPSNLSYITKDYSGAWGKTLAPCQHGKAFDKSAQMLMRWAGANNAVVALEDFGNALTFVGNAKLSTVTQILGLNTLALDGTGDYVTTPFTSFGSGSWEIFGSFRITSLAATFTLFNPGNAAGYGVALYITTLGKTNLYVSSNGTSWNVAAASAGVTTLVINTTYFYRVVFDSVAGTYRVYVSNNGAAEVQESTVSSTERVCGLTTFFLGAAASGGDAVNGFLGFTGVRRYASFTSAQATGPTVAPTFADVKTDFFSIPQMKMYEITAASTVAGTNPAMTAINKLYVGEVTTGAATVSAVVSYAFKGAYESPSAPFTIAVAGYPITHNIGVSQLQLNSDLICLVTANGYAPGDVVEFTSLISNGTQQAHAQFKTRLTAGVVNGYATPTLYNKVGAAANLVAGQWAVRTRVKRDW